MANIKKSFNFRDGIQVDEDNLLVTRTGLVGIGTTVPKEALDVIGNVVISGVTSSVFTQTGLLTVTTLNPTEIIGAGVSIQSGIITNPSMDNTGIVTYYGDGRYLQGLPTSQWEDTDAGFDVLSIFNTGGTVGIATTNPQSTLQVGNNPLVSQTGVGIASAGNITASGTITANTFSGSLTGNVTGDLTGNVTGNVTGNLTGNVTGNVTGNADSATVLETARNIAGVPFDGSADITLPGVNSSGTQNTSGTASNLSGSPNITVSGIDLNGNLDVSGTTTLTGIIEGTAGENKIPSLYANIPSLPSASTYHGMFAHVHATARGYFSHAGGWYELVNKETNGVVGTGTETYSIGSLSVGTNSPANDVHIRKAGNTELQITSDTGTAGITVGRESGVNNTNNAEIRYGADSSGATYSTAQSLDIINYGTDNFNYHLSANNASAVQGNFYWHKGINSSVLMTLTNAGLLGVKKSNPAKELDVEGAGKFSGDLEVGNDLTVDGTVTATDIIGQLAGDVTGTLTGNVNTVSNIGISTLNHLRVVGVATVGQRLDVQQILNIQSSGGQFPLNMNTGDNSFFVNATGGVGIRTTSSLANVTINASQANASIAAVAVGATIFKSSVDFADAGTVTTRFMLPPKISNTQRSNLSGVIAGGLIFNTSSNKLEFYDGSNWTALEANSGGGEVNQNAFSNIAVSGQTTVEADAASDTVTFVAGSNMTITTNATGDEITFASSGGGGGSGISDIVEDTTPQLGGDLSTNNFNILVQNEKEIRLFEDSNNGSNYVALKAPASLTSDITLTLPDQVYGGSVLTTNAAGVLSFQEEQLRITGFGIDVVSQVDVHANYSSVSNSYSGAGSIKFGNTLILLDGSLGDLRVRTPYGGGGSYSTSWIFGGHEGTNLSGCSLKSSQTITAPTLSLTRWYSGSANAVHEFKVSVASKGTNHRYNNPLVGSSSGYRLQNENGNIEEAPFLILCPGTTYRFNQSDSSNSGHPLRFYLEADKTTPYTTNVTTVGTAGVSGAYTEIAVTDDTPSILHYQCSVHPYMGNAVSTNSNTVNADRITDGTISDARFPAVLPAISGANLTNLPISDRISQDNSVVQVVDSGSTGFVKIDLENTERLRVASLGQIGLSGQNYGNAGEVITSQGSSSSPTWASPHRQIQDLQGTTSQINDDAYTELNITGYKAYSLFKIETSHESWVRVYVDDASRDADTTRSEGQDPAAGSGLIAEVRTSGAQTVLVTPGAFGFNNDNPRTNNIYLSVVNRSGSPQAITVTLTAIQIGE